MKRTIFLVVNVALAFVLLFGTTTPAQAAVSLYVNASKPTGVYYTDTNLPVSFSSYPGSYIVYTTNGTTPSAKVNVYNQLIVSNGVRYTGTMYLTSTRTFKAIAVLNWYTPASPVATFKYEIFKPAQLDTAIRSKFVRFNYSTYGNPQYFTAADGRKGSFPKYLSTGGINCTWYSYIRVRYNTGRNILFSTNYPLNGRDWYARAVSNSTQVKYSGSGALEALVKANGNRPVYNIVVSFPRNGSGTYGHVMLIDAIINGKVYFSDSSAPGSLKTKASIAEFKTYYQSWNGDILGVVHMK